MQGRLAKWVSLLTLVACVNAPGHAQTTDTGTAANTPADVVFDQFLTALNNTQLDAVLALFADDVLFWGTSMEALGTDISGVGEYFAPLDGQEPGVNIASGVAHSVREAADGLFLLSGTWQIDLAASDASPVFRVSMAVALRDGEWKIIQFHNSALP